ncbi:MAG: 16S rRNA (cytidine(1402)-2'-O)-methyltransferase [Flavobacteriales bacterium]|jgi:16S rRNA (cytidine1402-2'-O)-methyltransferase|nr:16S rRNA (cytidine(1402)-2'-O)-methyltransferase [Flavobacteriales bacterium]MBT5354497.1 16S rRNA (cytidine(1402)-2'-O)-methyltransferase [Flavobacteriales bacterium]
MSKLYVIPTPIGNLEDITLRALRLLKEVNLVLAEDTRTTKKLFMHYEINTKLSSFHMHNEHKVLSKYISRLKGGETFALVSDAGTPAISDPGFLLIRECVIEGIEVDCLPGATAFVPALVNSGLPNEKFVFEGFLPVKKGRQTRLKLLAEQERTMVFYESPHRIIKTLTQFLEYFSEERKVSISREISKMFEETIRGTISEALHYFEQKKPKGEFVIVVEGKKKIHGVK